MCSKLILVFVLISVVGFTAASPNKNAPVVECEQAQDFLSELILKFLDKLRTHMSQGIPDLNIPPLDPLDVPDESVTLKKNYEYDLKGSISSTKLLNLHQFNVTSISTSLFHMKADVSIFVPYLTLTGNYNLKGKALQFVPIRGSGPFIIRPSGVLVSVTTKLKLQDKHLQVNSMDFAVSMSSLNAKFEGLFGGGVVGNVANSLMNRFGLQIFKLVEPKIHNELRDDLIKGINQALQDIPIAELVGFLQSRYCRPATS